jgi:YrbI family 3-deoxy-D-manno-octulosonate 8-phosphate phosphatase
MSNAELHARCQRIEALIFDVDGVLTDGRIIYTATGDEAKAFHVRDGSGIKLWTTLGRRAAIITGRSSAIVDRRGKELGVAPVMQGVQHKGQAFDAIVADWRLDASKVAVLGDDFVDLPMLARAGLAVSVADACDDVRHLAHYTTRHAGGGGAAREVIELILTAQGCWARLVQQHTGVAVARGTP